MKRAFWIWNIFQCEGGDPVKIAAVAHRAGLTDVFIKVADGGVKFNVVNGVDRVPALVAALRAVGIRAWGWQYVYGANPTAEEKVASQRIAELKLDGFIVDAEAEFKQPGYGARAETYLSLLKQHNPNITIAFSSYRFPSYHREFPWAVFYKYCSINMPQVYWLQAHNAGQQTEKSFSEFEVASSLPLMPAGPAWKENGWRPTLQEVKDFEAVVQKHGATLVSYWSWEHCRRDLPELWPADALITPPVTPIPPVPPVYDDRLAVLEQKIMALEPTLKALLVLLLDLKAIWK